MEENLPTRTNTDDLTDRVSDYANLFWLPAICVFGIGANLVNIVVLTRSSLYQNGLLRNYLAIGFLDLAFLLVEFPIFTFRCGALCSYGYDYGAKVYELYVYLMLGYMFTTCSLLIDISVAFARLMAFYRPRVSLEKQQFIALKYKLPICMIVSAALTMPEDTVLTVVTPIARLVQSGATNANGTADSSRLIYLLEIRPGLDSLKPYFYLLVVLRCVLTILVLIVLDIAITVKLSSFMSSRDRTNPGTVYYASEARLQESRENQLTLMIVVICLVYIIGNFVDTVNSILYVVGAKIYTQFDFITLIGNTLLFASHGTNVFILYNFNARYRRELRRLLGRYLKLPLRPDGTSTWHLRSARHRAASRSDADAEHSAQHHLPTVFTLAEQDSLSLYI